MEAHRPSRFDRQTPGPRFVQSPSPLQAPQVFEPEHTGLASWQSVLATHSTQAPVDEQAGVVGVSVRQERFPGADLQPTHVPASEQNGVVEVGEQSASLPH